MASVLDKTSYQKELWKEITDLEIYILNLEDTMNERLQILGEYPKVSFKYHKIKSVLRKEIELLRQERHWMNRKKMMLQKLIGKTQSAET